MSNGITLGTVAIELLCGAIGGGAVWYGLNWYNLRKQHLSIEAQTPPLQEAPTEERLPQRLEVEAQEVETEPVVESHEVAEAIKGVTSTRYNTELSIYQEVWGNYVDLYYATLALREPMKEYRIPKGSTSEQIEEIKKADLENLLHKQDNSGLIFKRHLFKNEIIIAPEIYKSFEDFWLLSQSEYSDTLNYLQQWGSERADELLDENRLGNREKLQKQRTVLRNQINEYINELVVL